MALKYYFDESGNTGCLTADGSVSRFEKNNQQLYVSGAVCFVNEAEEKEYLNNYRSFKKRHGFHDQEEVKGSDLCTRKYNAALDDFIENVLDNKHVRVCLYDKHFYMATGIMTAILGPSASVDNPMAYYYEAGKLSLAESRLFDTYAKYSADSNRKNSKKLVSAVLDPWLTNLPKDSPLIKIAASIKEKNRYDLLVDSDAPINFYVNHLHQNLINVGAFCELLLMIGVFEGIPFHEMDITHDTSHEFANEYENAASILKCRFIFADSKESLGVQVADNISSVFFKAIKGTLSSFMSNKLWELENEWTLNLTARIISKVGIENIKFTIPLHYQAAILSILEVFNAGCPEGMCNDYVFKKLYEDNFLYALSNSNAVANALIESEMVSPFSRSNIDS